MSVRELAFEYALDRAIVTDVRDEFEGAAVGDVDEMSEEWDPRGSRVVEGEVME